MSLETPYGTPGQVASSTSEDHVGYLAHEIRNRLSTLIGKVYRFEDSYGVPASRTAELVDAVQHIAALVDDVATLAACGSFAANDGPQVMDLGVLVAAVAAEEQTLLGSQRVSVHPAGPAEVVADPRSMRRVLENVIGNALKYSDDDVHVHLDAFDNAVMVRVRDRGVGIEESDLERIFDAAYRSEDPAVRDENGSGLGLWVTRRLVEEHGGSIHAASELGVGTTFTITLPRRVAACRG